MVRSAFAALLVIGYVLFGLLTIRVFPLVWEDGPWYTQSAWTFVEQGAFTIPMVDGLAGLDRDNVVFGRIYLLLMAAAYAVADLSISAVRMVSFISALVALAAIYGVGRELWSPRVGVLAVVILAVAPNFVWQSHDARPEVMLVAAWTVALYLILSGDRVGSHWRLVAGGVIASLAADVHLNGLVVPIALFMILLVRGSERRHVAVYVVGVLIGAAWWLWVHVLPDPQLLPDQVALFSRGWPLQDILNDPVIVFALEVARYVLVEPRGSVLLLAVALVAALVLFLRCRDRALLSLLAFAGTVFLFMALMSGAKTPIYAIMLWPVGALLVARLLDVSPKPVAVGMAAALILVSVVSVGLTALHYEPADYDRYVAKIRSVLPSDAKVQAHPSLWFGLEDQPFIASHYFMWAGPYDEEVRRLGIEYVVADELSVLSGCSDCQDSMTEDVQRFLAENAELVAEVHDPFYGRVEADDGTGYVSRIYRITE